MFPSQHLVSIIAVRGSNRVRGLLADADMPDVTGGRGGWEAIGRARRTPVLEWNTVEARGFAFSIILMEGATPDVDAARRALMKIASMPSENVAPTLVRVEGNIPAGDGSLWAINGLVFSGAQRDAEGRYERVTAELTLIAADNLGDGVIVANRAPSFYVVRKGDTIEKIAVRLYGNVKHAKALAKAQSPKVAIGKPLKPGRRLVIP